MGCRKGIYYQITRVIRWNLRRIVTVNATMWGDIFHLFVGRNKKRKPVMEGNFKLNINIEVHMADLHCLFRYFKNIWSFLLSLISLNKDIFLPSCCRTEKKLVLSEERHFQWWHSPPCHVKFYDIIWIILSSNCNLIFDFNNYDHESTLSVGIQIFRLTIFKIHLYLQKEDFWKISKTHICLFWFQNLKGWS